MIQQFVPWNPRPPSDTALYFQVCMMAEPPGRAERNKCEEEPRCAHRETGMTGKWEISQSSLQVSSFYVKIEIFLNCPGCSWTLLCCSESEYWADREKIEKWTSPSLSYILKSWERWQEKEWESCKMDVREVFRVGRCQLKIQSFEEHPMSMWKGMKMTVKYRDFKTFFYIKNAYLILKSIELYALNGCIVWYVKCVMVLFF